MPFDEGLATVVHVAHLVASDGTLEAVSDLAIDMAAERRVVGGPWKRYEDKDDE